MAGRVPARLSAKEGRRFAFTLGPAFFVLGGIFWWRGRATVATVLWAIGGVLVLAGVGAPGRLGPVHRAWMGLALGISKVTTPVFLAIVFFVVIAPIGIVMRLVGRNPLRHRERDGSFWAAHGPADARRTMANQF